MLARTIIIFNHFLTSTHARSTYADLALIYIVFIAKAMFYLNDFLQTYEISLIVDETNDL